MKTHIQDKVKEGLNEEQLGAVVHGGSPLLIVAGAGTGKTLVLTRRIVHLILSKKAYPSEILALTFTEKAAQEMEERVDVLVPYGYTDMRISTFHAFGDRVLKENALEIGLRPDLYVLSRPEQIIFFRERLFEFPLNYFRPLGDPTKYIEAVLKLISRAKDEDISPEEYFEYIYKLKAESEKNPKDKALKEKVTREEEIALCYKKYQELLHRESKIDFGDQVVLTLKLFREHPEILEKYQNKFRYVLVDEFQDTNHSQFELLKLLVKKHNSITVCGDDDQSIYKFRGAALSNIMEFMDVYSDAKKIILRKSYRSTQKILDASYVLISNNNPDRLEVKEKLDKKLVSNFIGGKGAKHLCFDTASSEADWVAEKIERLVNSKKYSYKDFAILVRSNKDADLFLQALNMRQLPLRFSGSEGLYSQKEIRFFIAWLKFLTDPQDSLSLYYIMSFPVYDFDIEMLSVCMSKGRATNRALYFILKHINEYPELGSCIKEEMALKIKSFLMNIAEFFQYLPQFNVGRLLYKILTETGYLNSLTAGGMKAESKIKNIARFFEIVRNVSRVLDNENAYSFTPYLDALIEAGDNPSLPDADYDMDAVSILTIHKAKGLEFKSVFLVGLVSDRFPVKKRSDGIVLPNELLRVKERWLPEGDPHIQEERRLFYVGMTRAREDLFLTSARDYGGKRAKKVSVFVMEALDLPKQPGVSFKPSALEVIQRSQGKDFKTTAGDIPIRDDELLDLSHLQIDDYFTCPLKYKYVHILKVPVMQHHAVIYGKAIHDAIQVYLRMKINNKHFSLDEMLKIFENSWRSEGFLTREHEEMRFKEGEELLDKFYSRNEVSGVIPDYVEQDFVFLIDRDRISGRWDRIDTSGGKIRIIDYKTSKVQDQQKADKKAKGSLQLGIYALAYKNIHGIIPDWVELHFIDSDLIGRTQFNDVDLTKVKNRINEASLGIRKRDFVPKPSYFSCVYCVFRNICPYTLKGI
ncbi:MAG: ATP-dependent DNA helicase [Candidatus Saelkia tenebricola]|nr:ATP-dependent DNA helicase [Candidatus Saelkia tenebricola]